MTLSPPGPAEQPATGSLIRSVGPWGLAAMILNGLIGAAIFGLPASVAQAAGIWAPLVILMVAAAMLTVLLVMARLAALFDGTGGPIQYVEAAFGRPVAFQIGWMQLLSTTAAAAANVNLLADYALRGWPAAGSSPWAHSGIVLAALSLILIVTLNRTSGIARTLAVLAVIKLVPLVLLVVLAVPMMVAEIGPALASARIPAPSSLTQAALLCAYALVGFEAALTVAGEARDPKRDFPRALVMVFVTVALLYALLIWGYVITTPATGVPDKAPLVSMAVALIGGIGGLILLATATVSIFANVLNNMLFLSRRLVAMEALGGLPALFGRIRAVDAVPRNAVISIMAVVVALSLSGGFVALAVLSVASRLIVYLACIAALPVIERRAGQSPSISGSAVIVAAAITCTGLIAGSEAASWRAMAGAALVGAILYVGNRLWRVRAGVPTR